MIYKDYIITHSKVRKLLIIEQKLVLMCKDSWETESTARLFVSTHSSGRVTVPDQAELTHNPEVLFKKFQPENVL